MLDYHLTPLREGGFTICCCVVCASFSVIALLHHHLATPSFSQKNLQAQTCISKLVFFTKNHLL